MYCSISLDLFTLLVLHGSNCPDIANKVEVC